MALHNWLLLLVVAAGTVGTDQQLMSSDIVSDFKTEIFLW